jgi:hypothetical protein
MSTTRIYSIGAILLIIIVAGLYWHASTTSAADKAAVRSTITTFGQQLQKVSLLAPNASTTIASTYAAYATPQLLASWEADPESAPGRLTSSPWPDHIDITSVQKTSEGYAVQGNLILMTSNEVEHGGNAGSEPVSLQLVKTDGKWLISSYQATAPGNQMLPAANSSASSASNSTTTTTTVTTSHVLIPAAGTVSITGTMTCLPHKNTTGPQTLECAFGLKDAQGNYYALRDTDPNYKNVAGADGNSQVTVHGTFTLGTNPTYNIVGTIDVTSITK